ncbi:MAG: CBS domain-containing protein [Planctomycetota bacterium]|nr:CBS domain-containing protein [Planctomycetota bacterium]MDA1212341.1 CBS domain-containing protein [Planctomycetota bacterium]
MTVLVRDLMTHEAVCISLDSTIQAAAELLTHECVGELYATDDVGRLVGVIPDYEILKALYMEAAPDRTVADYVSCQIPCCTADEDLDAVLPLFREQRCRVIAVVRDRKVIGQIHRRDLLRWILVKCAMEQKTAPMQVKTTAGEHSTEPTPIRSPRFLQKRPSVFSSDALSR